jgi:hypothetical protein
MKKQLLIGSLFGLMSLNCFAQYNALETLAQGTQLDFILTSAEVLKHDKHVIDVKAEGKFRYRQDFVQVSPAFSNIIPLSVRLTDVPLTSDRLEYKNLFLEFYNLSNLAPGSVYLSCSLIIGQGYSNVHAMPDFLYGDYSRVEKKLSPIDAAIEAAQLTVTSSIIHRAYAPTYCELVVGNEYPWMGQDGGTQQSNDQSTN